MADRMTQYRAQQERIKATLRQIVKDEKGKVPNIGDDTDERDVIFSIGGALRDVTAEFCDEDDLDDVLADLGLTVAGN